MQPASAPVQRGLTMTRKLSPVELELITRLRDDKSGDFLIDLFLSAHDSIRALSRDLERRGYLDFNSHSRNVVTDAGRAALEETS